MSSIFSSLDVALVLKGIADSAEQWTTAAFRSLVDVARAALPQVAIKKLHLIDGQVRDSGLTQVNHLSAAVTW